MKNVFIIFIVASMAFLSCSKEEGENSIDVIANAGSIHNQLLKNYYQNRLNTAPLADELISEIITLSSEYLISAGYDQENIIQTETLLKANYKTSNLKSVMNSDFSIDIEKFAQQITEMGIYSKLFIEEVDILLKMVSAEAEIGILSNYINTVFSQIEFNNDVDQDGQSLFVNIFNGSCDFWTEEYSTNLKDLKIDPSTWVMINDGIGGILGSIFGPIGSIVCGTAFSAFTNEEIR